MRVLANSRARCASTECLQCQWRQVDISIGYPANPLRPLIGILTMPKDLYRVVTTGSDGELRVREYPTPETLLKLHTQVGIDDCSTDLALRGMPVFRGLIGPMPEGKNVIRYESPEVFETLTKEWSSAVTGRRSRTRRPTESV